MEIKSAKGIIIWGNISWSCDRVKSQEQFALKKNFNSPIELHVHGIAKGESNLNGAHTWLSKVELMAGVIMEALFHNWKRILISRQRGFGG